VISDYSTTGDGLVASLQILNILIDQQKPISQIAKIFTPYPQILKNVKFTKITNPLEDKSVIKFIAEKENELQNQGRILVRKSGTENLIRVMVEGKNYQQIEKIANEICQEICQ
jgi:phosphoglucosamine mutase